ncbi:unnamed protein product (macronuclear) [Paramecium tetraurelia]|uniref:Uncharacterized protein n=1 Tax=Paramecium tetraurelia TaxID=5888 RepID=A0EFD6_PARTE|nr:uncharacterized protein GSPATT00026350001 [Paramecium tetraurelia]CAK94027.1 unnamed protein product [Paramecium tetraurelia]|eukprot:XP_001461400.1 hypothetical protein (macronuclear) [Paramecium tetraurelia strain d4-2]
MNKNVYKSEKDYMKRKQKLYQDKLNIILSDIEQFYQIRLSRKQFLIRYFQYLLEFNERQLKGDISPFFYEMVDYFKEFNIKYLFPKQIWTFDVAKSFINSLYNVSDSDIINIFIMLNLILEGKLNYSSESVLRVLPYEGGNVKFPFEYDYVVGFNFQGFLKLVIQVIPKLFPILNGEGKLTHFEFRHLIILVGLGPENQKNSIGYYEIDKYFRNQQTSPNFFANMKLVKEQIKDEKLSHATKIGEKPKSWKDLLLPRKFESIFLDSQDYVYNEQLKRWIPVSTQIILNNKMARINQFSSNHFLIQKYSQQPSAFQLFKIIQNIPNYKVNLTNEQQEIISYNGDGLVIGRSGTGKTTCALLRLFTTDILFKIRSKLDQIGNQTTAIQLNQQQKDCQLKTIFVTASPLLACQVKRLYDKLVQNIQDVINNKKMRQQSNQANTQEQNDQEGLDQSTFQIIDAIKNDQEQQECQQLNEEVEVDDQDIDEYEKEMGKFLKFSDVNQFPIFVTLRKFLFLVDTSLINSFFAIFGHKQDKSSQWHNEQFGQMKLSQNNNEVIEKKLEQINQKLMDEIDNSDYIQTKMHEVTQDVFVRIFWPKILATIKLERSVSKCFDPIYVWSEICTKIKGHETSHEYPDRYMNYDNYYYMQGQSEEECSFVYEAFQIYEQLKYQLGYYDLLDLVNHINQELAFGDDVIENVHYLLLDELQDVPRAVLILLDQLTELGLFCCGDNAQNIAKGIGYKFFEVQNCLLSYRNSKKKVHRNLKIFDLSVNFRSHNNILQLANSVIRMIEILFPYKIDKLKKETSNLNGPKPIIIKSDDVNHLLSNLCDFFSNDQLIVEFGCNQVIIVKDQESKTKLPIELQNILCLTIYEAKGLEFDDVILFNFFHDSTASIKDWESLNDLEPQAEYLKKADYEKFITNHQTEIIASSEQKNNNELVEVWQLKHKNMKEYQQISIDLCQELKQLYVAITRPKQRLIIFDQSLEKRRIIQNIWTKLNAVKVVDSQGQQKDIKFQLQLQNNNKENWKQQGFKMFRMNNYDQAAKCFKFAQEKQLEQKSIAYYLVVNNAHIANNHQQFLQAAKIFEEIGLLPRAAQCYFTAKEFQKAQELYEQLGQINEMAESAFFAKNYEKAAQAFEILGDLRRSIDCYCLSKEWDKVIMMLNKYKNEFSNSERQAFLNSFFPNYLQNLAQEIQIQGAEQIDCTQEFQEINQEDKSVLNQSESFVIQNSILDESENQQDSQVGPRQIINQSKVESSQEILNFEDNEQSQSFQIENESQQNMDHLSIFDPEDEWLKLDQKSLIKSMSSKISHQSEFSNIVLLNQPAQVSLLTSKNNPSISNKILQELIQKFQLFSNEFKNHLVSQKYQSVQLSNRKDDDKEFDHIINFVYDLDNIDIDSIYMILDLLEDFKSYKLCIYLCNHFKLASYLGRYLVSLVSSYSTLPKTKALVLIQMITMGSQRRNLLEQSAISQIAINNILETINPIFLTFKNEEELSLNNSLGLSCYQQLIGLGFWKTFVYQLNFKHSIDLCMSFNNFSDGIEIFNKIQLHRKTELSEEDQFKLKKIQYYQQIRLIQGQQDRASDFAKELDNVFQLTKNYYTNKKQVLEEVDLNQLIVNANIYKKGLSFNQQLKQIEAVILSFDILKLRVDCSDEIFIGLFEIVEYFHNSLISFENQENIKEALLFCYGFSIPQGEIMSHYSHSLLIHISSKIIKQVVKDYNNKEESQKQNSSLIFVDIGYEYISIPFEQAIELIKNTFSLKIQLILNNKSKKSMEYYQVNDDDSFSVSSQEDWEDTLAELLVFLMLEQSNKRFQSKTPQNQRKEEQKKLHPLSIYYSKQTESQEYSIIDSEPSQILQLIQRIILKNNLRITNTPNYIKQMIREISLNLIIQNKNSKDNYHSAMIRAINLLNLTDQLSFAVLILQKQKKGNEAYLKYIEFLECQNFGIIEDAIGCFLDYSQYVLDRFYLDEQLSHLIRIGLNILISLLSNSQEKLTIIKAYKEYLNNIQNVEEQNCKLEIGVFQLKNQELIEEYLQLIFEFYQSCCSKYYQDQILQFLMVFAINLLNIQQIKTIKSIIEFIKENKQLKTLQRLQDLLVKETSKNKQEIQHKKHIMSTLTNQLDEDIVEVNVVNIKSEQQLDECYDKCIQVWNNYQSDTDKKVISIRDLITKWKGFRKDHKTYLSELIKRNLLFKRSLQYFRIGDKRSSGLILCQTLKDLNRYMKYNNSNFNDNLQQSVVLQRQLLKARQNFVNSLDVHLINSFLNDLGEQMKLLMQGNDIHKKVKQLEMDLKGWEQNDEERQIEEKMMELNRQLIVEKWRNLKAGIKVQSKQQNQNLQPKAKKDQLSTIQEVVEEV